MKALLCFLAMWFASSASGAGVSISRSDISPVLEPIRAKNQMISLAGAVIRSGKVEAIGAVGLRKKGSPGPITINDQFHIGSDAKAMTASVIAMLVEEGKLRWDQTLAETFPEMAEGMLPVYRTVTLEQLLTHRGGIEPNPTGLTWMHFVTDKSTSPTLLRLELIKSSLSHAPQADPGTRMVYSNAGYAIAGAMAERATGKPWEKLIREKLFIPLGMRSAGFGPPGTLGKVDQPWGHSLGFFGTTATQTDNPMVISPAGTVHMSLSDWAKFVAFQMGHGPALLKPESLKKLHAAPPGSDYAMGWIIAPRPWADGEAWTHTGSNTFWTVTVWVAPRKDVAVLVATNQAGGHTVADLDEAAVALLQYAGMKL